MGRNKLLQGPAGLLAKFNRLVDRVKRLEKGGNATGRITTTQTGTGNNQDLSMNRTRPRMAKVRRQIGIIRRAKTTAAAGASTTIVCNLYDSDGVEQLTGDESGITVYCTVVDGGANLNAALARYRDNQDIFVTLLPFSSTILRWYAPFPFQPSGDC